MSKLIQYFRCSKITRNKGLHKINKFSRRKRDIFISDYLRHYHKRMRKILCRKSLGIAILFFCDIIFAVKP